MTTPFWLAPAVRLVSTGASARLSVLIFHRVHKQSDPLFPGSPDAARFEACMEAVRQCFAPISLLDACKAVEQDRIPPRAIAITFDDGYADNHAVALPILKRLGLHATFFVASDFIDGGRMWNDTIIEAVRRCPEHELDLTRAGLGRHPLANWSDRRLAIDNLIGMLKYHDPAERARLAALTGASAGVALPSDLMMTSGQVRELASAGMSVGGHTCSHPILARISDADARREIADGRDVLAGIVKEPIRLFAYPNGKPGRDYGRNHVELVRELGFTAAVSTAPGVAAAGSDRWQLPRFTPWELRPEHFALRLAASRHTARYDTA